MVGGGIAILIVILLVISLTAYDPPTHADLANYKLLESVAYSMKGNGDLGQMVLFIEGGNSSNATSLALGRLRQFSLPGSASIELRMYSDTLVSTQNYTVANGRLREDIYSVFIPFTTNSTSKFGIAKFKMGVKSI